MIQLSLLPALPQGPVRPALLAASAGSFALALGALVLPKPGAPAAEGDAETLLPGRQAIAETGKDLPELTLDADGEADAEVPDEDDERGADIAFAWFVLPVAPETAPAALPAPAIESAVAPRADIATALIHAAPPSSPALAGAEASPSPIALEVAPATALPAEPALAVPTTVEPTITTPEVAIREPAARASLPKEVVPETQVAPTLAPAKPATVSPPTPALQRTKAPTPNADPSAPVVPTATPLSAARPLQPQPAPVVPAPILAAAIELAGVPISAPSRRAPAIEPAAIALAPTAPDLVRPHAVAAAADVQQGVIDMRRQEWMGQMIEQIEAMRDAAPVRETRLSLAPEALGKVDVSIRQEGDRVHVHFATETQAARQLIADAQPRLTELAEARGLKLGQTSFDSATAGQGGRDGREPFAQPQSRTPRPSHSETPVGTPDDDRIA